jgi:uncharacterized protein (TIGR03437 family)
MFLRSLPLILALVLPSVGPAQLTTNGNQYWQQGFADLPDMAEPNDNLGWAVAIGDFDGDGIMDAAVGAPGEDNGRGLVHVLFGDLSGLTAVDNQVWKPGSDDFPGSWESGDFSGSALAAGDFNGDGFADLAIGTPGEDNNQGAVNVLYGSEGNGLTLNGFGGFNQGNLEGDGTQNGDRFGASLASGDFNGDGFDDIVVGSPGEANSGGLVHVLYGSSVGLRTNGNQRWRQGEDGIPGSRQSGDSFGYALATGDFNNDGFDDVVIGVPGEDSSRGSLHVLFGSGGGIGSGGNQRWFQGENGLPDEDESGDVFGISLTTGDFNGDDFEDIAAGSIGENSGRGNVIIIPGSSMGPNGASSIRFEQGNDGIADDRESGDNFGQALASGDFNLDGFDDLAIGVPAENSSRGIVHAIYGGPSGLSGAGNQIYAQAWQGMQGEDRSNDAFGFVLAAGDFGGDFADDLIVGVPNEDGGGSWGVFQTLLGNEKPTINAVVSAGLGVPAITTLSPNTLATAFGTGLYESAAGRGVGAADLVNGALPTVLERTCLEIDGQRSPLLFLRNDQVNFQVRSSVNGQMQVRLIRNCGEYYELPGNAISVPVAPVSPDLFAYEVYEDGSKSVAAIKAISRRRVGPTALGPEFEPALPGEIVELYVTGLGLTNPPFAAGQLPPNDASGARPAPPVTVIIDGLQAEVQYAGSAPGFAGLYQINVVIPATPNIGEVPITIISSGGGPAATTPSNGFIAVQ